MDNTLEAKGQLLGLTHGSLRDLGHSLQRTEIPTLPCLKGTCVFWVLNYLHGSASDSSCWELVRV